MPAEPPLLFVDVDGVLNPYAAGVCPDGFIEHELFPGEEPVRLCPRHGRWLHELAEVYELVWGSSWRPDDRAALAAVLELPPFHGAVTLPAGEFDPREKVPAVELLAGDRPLAWLDDLLVAEAWNWAEQRGAATLLLSVDPAVGLTRSHVDTLLRWAAGLH